MMVFDGLLLISTLFCSIVLGFLFTYAVVIMPGFKRLKDRDIILAFQMTDGIVQNNQPLFMLSWLGSIGALVATTALGFMQLTGEERIATMVSFSLMVLLNRICL